MIQSPSIKMKTLFLFIGLCLITLACPSQENTSSIQPYFSAIIVSDIENSIDWYSKRFNFKVVSKTDLEERGFKQANLKTDSILLELIEIEGTFDAKKAVEENTEYKFVKGIFKIGFQVNDLNFWIEHLKNEQTDFFGDVVSDPNSGKKMLIIKDPDGNYIQLFEK